MRRFLIAAAWVVTVVGAGWSVAPPAMGEEGGSGSSRRTVLVELYTSQGCNSCPPASDLLGKLKSLSPGAGGGRVVALNFHVDYFDQPWADPFGSPDFSRREAAYNGALKRDDLYFTPMLIVDGRVPMLGSDRPKLLAALRQAAAVPPGLRLSAKLEGEGERRTLRVDLARPTVGARDHAILVGVALTEDPIRTAVRSGENAGKTLVEHHVVRRFAHKDAKLEGAGSSASLRFPLSLEPGQASARTTVVVFAQDNVDGGIHQAMALPWEEPASPSEGGSGRR